MWDVGRVIKCNNLILSILSKLGLKYVAVVLKENGVSNRLMKKDYLMAQITSSKSFVTSSWPSLNFLFQKLEVLALYNP